jgi:ABC-2 type transport system permease protein
VRDRPRRWVSRALVELTLVRFREFWREPEAIFWAFLFPLLLTIGLAIAFRNQPAEALRVGASSAELAAALETEPGLAVTVVSAEVGRQRLATGKLALLVAGRPGGGVVYRYDDTIPDARTARVLVERALARSQGRYQPPAGADDLTHEPGSRYVDFLVPGLLGMTLMGDGIWGVGFPIVDARRRKLLKRLVASPMSRAEYLASFLLYRLGLLVIEVLLLVGFGVWVFGVPIRGPLWQLGLVTLLSALTFGALGLLIASRVRTFEGASGLMNFTMLPMWIFSGVFFASSRFPDVLQPMIRALPLTAVVNLLRGTLLEGMTLSALALDLGVAAAWLVLSFTIAIRIFRWS